MVSYDLIGHVVSLDVCLKVVPVVSWCEVDVHNQFTMSPLLLVYKEYSRATPVMFLYRCSLS
jgi:hypothetical protein